jgi:hypothetical protein
MRWVEIETFAGFVFVHGFDFEDGKGLVTRSHRAACRIVGLADSGLAIGNSGGTSTASRQGNRSGDQE